MTESRGVKRKVNNFNVPTGTDYNVLPSVLKGLLKDNFLLETEPIMKDNIIVAIKVNIFVVDYFEMEDKTNDQRTNTRLRL